MRWYSGVSVGLACSIVLHTPDGHRFKVRADAIRSVEDATYLQDHLAKHTNTIIHVDGKGRGVRETEQQIADLERSCSH